MKSQHKTFTNMPAGKAGKDQKSLYRFSQYEYGNTNQVVCCSSHLQTTKTSATTYILKAIPKGDRTCYKTNIKTSEKTRKSNNNKATSNRAYIQENLII